MRLSLLTATIILTLLIFSCKKDLSNSNIIGKWNVITDSSFAGFGAGNHPVNYAGQQGDYFNFNTDGKLYISEDGNKDTVNYTLLPDNKLIIETFGIELNGTPDTSLITTLTDRSAVIVTPVIRTPGGTFGRKVTLSR